jgi:acyl carrier protein
MQQQEIFEKIKRLVVDNIGLSPGEIHIVSDFRNDLGIDSLMLSELIMNIEDEFHLEISDKDASQIRTVGDAVEYLLKVAKV